MTAGELTNERTDEALIARVAQQGSVEIAEESFYELYHRYHAMLPKFIAARIGREHVDDLSQETWARIWKKADRFGSGSFRAWMFTIAANLIKDRYRSLARSKESFLSDHDQLKSADAPFVGSELIDQEERAALANCLKRLESRERGVVSKRLQGHLYESIAAEFELSESNARKIWYRAKKQLTQCVLASMKR